MNRLMMNLNIQVNSKNLLNNSLTSSIKTNKDESFDKVFKEKINEPKEEYSKTSKTEHKERAVKKIGNAKTEKEIIDKEDPEDIEKARDENIPEEITNLIAALDEYIQELAAMEEIEGNQDGVAMKLEDIKSHLNKILSFIEKNNTTDIKENIVSKEILQQLTDQLQIILDQNEVKLGSQDFNQVLSKLEVLLKEQASNDNEIGSAIIGDTQNKENSDSIQNKENLELDTDKKDNYSSVTNEAQTNAENERQMSQNNSKNEKFGFFANKTQKTVINDQLIQDIPTNYTIQNNMNGVEHIKLETTTVQKPNFQNILEQVVDKAQVIIDEKGSEMTLHLKPNNLGNLSMKIAVERGIVIADIVAENQVVKEVLESNFNALRDALNEKGFGIQELNVSVGQDSDFQQQQNFMNFNKKNSEKTIGNSLEYENVVSEEQISNVSSINESTIDQLG